MNGKYYAFYPFSVNDENAPDDPELLAVLKKKQENRPNVIRMIDGIVADKQSVFSAPAGERQICLIGHSQIDQWESPVIGGYHVRNCGVSGITSFEYDEKILQPGSLSCEDDVFLVMHGTNDIVWDFSIEEIVKSIRATIDYIRQRNAASPIIFPACLHVKGRIDRSNVRIDDLNTALKNELSDSVIWIDTAFMDGQNGELNENYTNDGLHLTDIGYRVFQEKIEKIMKEYGL